MVITSPEIGSIFHAAHVAHRTATPPQCIVHSTHVLSLHRATGNYGLGEEEHRVQRAAMILLPAGTRDANRLTGPDRAWWVHFDGAAIRHVRGGTELNLGGSPQRAPHLRHLTPSEDRTAGAWFRELHAAWCLGTPIAGLIVRARIFDLLGLWAGSISHENNDDVELLRKRIERHACESATSLSDLMRGLTSTHDAVSAAFRKRLGTTPVAYRTRQRLQKAREMLVHDPQTLEAIASHCGFADAGYFCRIFRQHVGMSPRTYARRLRCE